MQLILASRSPYRREQLARLGIPFQCIPANINEQPKRAEAPPTLALRLATEKALAVSKHHPNTLVIGADQVATIDGTPLGKPGSLENARAQLKNLAGKTVQFHSAICVTDGQTTRSDNVITLSTFRPLSETEINCYLEREAVLDTTGSAKAEGLGIALMQSIQSDDPTAIVGLPLIALSRLLREFGINPITYQHTTP